MWVRGRHIRQPSWKRASCTKDAQLGFSIKQSFTLEPFPFSMVLSLPKHIWQTFRERERLKRQKYIQERKHGSHCDTSLVVTLLSGSDIFVSIMVFHGNVIRYVHFRWRKEADIQFLCVSGWMIQNERMFRCVCNSTHSISLLMDLWWGAAHP